MDAVTEIKKLARRVKRRIDTLSLLDHLVQAVFAGGLIASTLVVLVKWRALPVPVWLIALLAFAGTLAIFLIRWQMKRASETASGFLIDASLDLEDRFTTAQALLVKREGNAQSPVRQALIEDAANRITDARAESIAPFHVKKYYALSLLALLAFGASLMIREKTLPGTTEIVEAREDIQAAGEQLEKSSTEIEKFTPPQSVTANLAKEQAELGRSLRRSTDSRAEVLKKLSALEERIRQRADELKSTRADEVVAAAEKTLRPALTTAIDRNIQPPQSEKEASSKVGDSARTSTAQPETKASDNKAEKPMPKEAPVPEKAASTGKQDDVTTPKPKPDEKSSKPSSPGQDSAKKQPESDPPAKQATDIQQAAKPDGQPPSSPQAGGGPDRAKGSEQQKPESSGAEKQDNRPEESEVEKENPSSNPLTDIVASQSAKALPALSDQLMQKAGELRAGQLKPEEIKNLALSAGQLAKQLAPLAQNKEFQESLMQMAKSINPEQLERVAKELMKNEKLMKELEAAAKLLAENQEVKKMVAGLQRMGEEIARDWERKNGPVKDPSGGQIKGSQNGQQAEGSNNRPGQSPGLRQGNQTASAESNRNLKGQGKESRLSGNMQQKPGGEYVFSGSKPGVGAVRVPYSTAYPQYRREAERTVERSQVPTHLRSMVRNYFDAINPDAKKSN